MYSDAGCDYAVVFAPFLSKNIETKESDLKEIVVRAPATIANFGPGFDIFALALEDPYDEMIVRLNNRKGINIEISGIADEIPTNVEANTAGLAAIHFLRRLDIPVGIDVHIKKGIRPSTGLGSSGASAAACTYALNRLLKTDLNSDTMVEIASKGEIASAGVTHGDNVAGCLLGGFVFIKSYNPMKVGKIDVFDIPLVICAPFIFQARKTENARKILPKSLNLASVIKQISGCSSLIHAILNKDLGELGKAVNQDHIAEPARSKTIPGYNKVKRRVLEAGAYSCNISEAGPSIFAVCKKESRKEIGELMRKFFSEFGIESEVTLTRASNEGVRDSGIESEL